jgi:hypothetical protein
MMGRCLPLAQRGIPFVLLGAVATFVSCPLWPHSILSTPDHQDLANHVRHVDEYRLALAEGQLPPRVAPSLNGETRLPLFQYYTGTAYVIPGLLSRAGLAPYGALKLAIVLQSWLGGLALFAACRMLTRRAYPALIAAVAFQLFPFGGVDLYNRGAYPEWASLQWMPVVFWASLSVVGDRGTWGNLLAGLGCCLAWAFFLPLHPSQSAYSGTLLFVLTACHVLRQPARRRLLGRLLCASGSAALLTTWYWLPILLDFHSLRITGYLCVQDGGATWQGLLWPWLKTSYADLPGWALQIGLPFVVAAAAAVVVRPALRQLRWMCGVAFFVTLVLIIESPTLKVLQPVLCGIQYNYRLLLLAAIPGAVCLAWSLARLNRHGASRWGLAVQTAVLIWVVAASAPYFRAEYVGRQGAAYPFKSARPLGPSWSAPNSSFYAFVGTDFAKLNWFDQGRLRTNQPLAIPAEGVPFVFEITFPPDVNVADLACCIQEGAASQQRLDLVRDQTEGGATRLQGSVTPARGCTESIIPRTVCFVIPSPLAELPVSDVRFRAVADAEDGWFRPLPVGQRQPIAAGQRLIAQANQAGLYQLPIHAHPQLQAYVNGAPQTQASVDRYLLVLPLQAGRNEILVTTAPNRWGVVAAWVVPLFWLTNLLVPAVRRRLFGDAAVEQTLVLAIPVADALRA